MTREKAREFLIFISYTLGNTSIEYLTEKDGEKMREAIKALEQEPCEDVINREAVHEAIEKWAGSMAVLVALPTREVRPLLESIHKLPPANPHLKAGRWIMPVQDDGMSAPIYYQVRCSECGFDLDPQTWHMELHQYGADKYCPNCGAKMFEPQERSDKE